MIKNDLIYDLLANVVLFVTADHLMVSDDLQVEAIASNYWHRVEWLA